MERELWCDFLFSMLIRNKEQKEKAILHSKRIMNESSESLSRERFWDVQVAKITSITRRAIMPRPSSSPGQNMLRTFCPSLKWLDAGLKIFCTHYVLQKIGQLPRTTRPRLRLSLARSVCLMPDENNNLDNSATAYTILFLWSSLFVLVVIMPMFSFFERETNTDTRLAESRDSSLLPAQLPVAITTICAMSAVTAVYFWNKNRIHQHQEQPELGSATTYRPGASNS